MAVTMFSFIYMVSFKNIKGLDKRLHTLGTTSQRQVFIAIVFAMIEPLIIIKIGGSPSQGIIVNDTITYSIFFSFYVFISAVFYLRNTYKILFRKFSNVLLD